MWTPPSRKLTPDTSYGFDVIAFAALVLGEPLDPWQQWLVIHLGELLPDGRPRFRQVLVLVARQQGKTHVCKVLALYWMFVERHRLVFGTSTNLDYARESWAAAVETAQRTPALAARVPSNSVRKTNGQETFTTTDRCRYKIGAANRRGGRSLSIDRIIGDELREHRSWDAYNASYNAMNARPAGQAVYITNQGDAQAVVLASLRKDALDFLETGAGDGRLGLFEWSAPPGTHPMDPAGWAAANPQLGRREGRMDYDIIRGPAARVSKPGCDLEELAGFLTEMLCMSVPSLDSAIDPAAWLDGRQPDTLDAVRGRLAACVDVAPDGRHATLAVAGLVDEQTARVEVIASWDGPAAVEQLRRDLPDWVRRVKPQVIGWYPSGPAAAVDAELRDRRKAGRRGWPPRGVTVQEIKSDTEAVCMGFASRVAAGRVLHSGQPLLDAQVDGAEKLHSGDRWTITRRGAGHVDAVYAVAGADHLVRVMPVRRRATRLHVAAG